MTLQEQNFQRIKKLESLGVDTGYAKNVVEMTTNRNFTLDSELTACEILMKVYDPKENKIGLLFIENGNKEIDIKINKMVFPVKRIVIPRVQQIVYEMLRFYAEILMRPNRFIQAIIAKDEDTGLDIYEELNVNKTEGISGAEILIDLSRFKDLIAKKILRGYDIILGKSGKEIIPIIDVRYFPIPDYDYIKREIHNHYSEREYFLLLLTYDMENDGPCFYPIYYPEEKYSSLIEELSDSISYNPFVHKYEYCYLPQDYSLLIRDENGFIIIKGERICKSLIAHKKLMVYGVLSKSKSVTKLSYLKKGERKEVNVEYLKLPENNPTGWRRKWKSLQLDTCH
jgi:hypothetical protein